MRDGKGNTCPIIWKSKVARRVIGSTLAAKVVGMIEALEWAEYIKFLWMETIKVGKCLIRVYTNCKPLEMVLKTEGSIKNRMLRIDLAQIKQKLENPSIESIQWIDSNQQLADDLTKWKSNKGRIREEVMNEEEKGKICVGRLSFC